MSEITFECANCGASISVDESAEGWIVRCGECDADTPIPESGIFSGLQIGSFKLLKHLRSSEMGEIWLAGQVLVERKVMVKILPKILSSDELMLKRFEREAKNSSKLDHPNIVKWLDYGEENGKRFIATTYMDGGKTLSELLSERDWLSEEEALFIAEKIASALSYAWDKFTLVHRNIKPSNILIGDDLDNVQLMNFGLSKMVESDSCLTARGSLLGTFGFMSPEQHKCDQIDCRSDIYSLGATIFRILSGGMPFAGEAAVEVLENQLAGNIRSVPGISKNCARLLKKMLEPSSDKRPQNWGEVIKEIKTLKSEKNESKRSVKKVPRKKKARAVPSLEKVARDSFPSSKNATTGKKKFPWASLTIASTVVILTLAVGLFLFKQHEAYKKQKEREALAKLEAKKKMQNQIALENKRRETEWKKRRMDKLRKAYKDALEYAEENKAKPHLVKYHFKRLKKFFKNSPYEDKFNVECEKTLARMDKLELDKRKESVMYAIQNAVANLVREKEYRQAALYYRDYAGDLAAETESERRRKVTFYLALAKEREAELAKAKKEVENERSYQIKKEFGGVATASGSLKDKEEKKAAKRLGKMKRGMIKISTRVRKDLQNTADGKEQKIFPEICVNNKLGQEIEGHEIVVWIVCQSRTNKKEYCLYKILTDTLSLNAKSSREINLPGISVPYRNAKTSKEDELEYEGCVIAMKDADGNLIAMHTDCSKLAKIKDKILAYQEGVFFNRKGDVIIK